MPESVCSKPAVPLGQPVFSVPGAPSVFHREVRKVWKSLHAAAFYTPGSPLTVPADSTGVSWSGLPDPLVSGAPLQGAQHRANRPHLKIPGTRSGMPGIFIYLQLLYRGSLQLVDHTDFRCDTQVAGRRKGGIGKAAVLCLLAHQCRSAIGALLHRDHIAQGASGCFRHLLS